jgi:hypothetical protein
MSNSSPSFSGILLDILKDIFFFPFWWYSFGLIKIAKSLAAFVANKGKSLGLLVWIKNIFVPMYGQRDWQGKIISFCIRLVQIIFRTIFFVFWVVLALILFFAWFLTPIVIVYMIALQF